MSLYLDVVCTESRIPTRDRQEKTVRVIGEILPYVLAKYGVCDPLSALRKAPCRDPIRTGEHPARRHER